ncbi:MAG: methionyl-tRNA formyltransferase [Cyclobacteriaceae bacterium]
MKDLRIIFMGTPEFAVPSLNELVAQDFNVVAVITAPDKPAGRGKKICTSAVKDAAVAHNIPVLQPTNLKNENFIEELKSYQADLQVIVAFRMLPEVVWDMPPLGSFNLHASLLPQYRGAAPINWAVINGEKETGCTTFFLQHAIDTGDIILQEKETISREDTVGDVYERLMYKGAKLVATTTEMIAKDEVVTSPQNINQVLKSAPKIFKETCEINWEDEAEDIFNFVRGLSPYPASWTTLNNKQLKVFKASVVKKTEEHPEEQDIYTDNKSFLYFSTADDWIAIEELQLEGKKRMTVTDFLCGYQVEIN